MSPDPARGAARRRDGRAVAPVPDAVSADPGPRHRTPAVWGLVLAVLFILYETTIPFRFSFDRAALAEGWRQALLIPFKLPDGDWSSRADVMLNVLLFMPLGFFLALAAPGRDRGGRLWRLTGLGLLLSLAVETLQLFSPLRFTQTSDLITNTAGTALGALAALHGGGRLYDRGCDWLLGRLREDPAALVLPLLTAVILAGALLPLDFYVSAYAIRLKLAHMSLSLVEPPTSGRLLAFLGLFKQSWLFAFWGAAAADRFAEERAPLARTLGLAAVLAVAVECGHMLVRSREIWILTPLVSWCGAGLGAALVLWGHRLGLGRRRLVWIAAAGYGLFLVADCVSPLAAELVRRILGETIHDPGAVKGGWMPWLPADTLPVLTAMGEMLARLFRFVPLAAAVRMMPWRRSTRLAAVWGAAAAVLGLEWLVWRFSTWSGNMSEVVLAWAGLATGWYVGRRLLALRAAPTPLVEESRT